MIEENAELNDEFNSSRWKNQIQFKKRGEGNRFESENLQNFRILEEKIHLIRCEMTEENAELNGEFNSSRLKIQIQVKLEGRGKWV